MTGMTNEEHLIEANELLREELDDARGCEEDDNVTMNFTASR